MYICRYFYGYFIKFMSLTSCEFPSLSFSFLFFCNFFLHAKSRLTYPVLLVGKHLVKNASTDSKPVSKIKGKKANLRTFSTVPYLVIKHATFSYSIFFSLL